MLKADFESEDLRRKAKGFMIKAVLRTIWKRSFKLVSSQ